MESHSLESAFPGTFEFYHLGSVEKQPYKPQPITFQNFDFEELQGVSFSLHGDAQGLVVLLFDEGLDVSTYTELGNVLASRVANELSLIQGWDVMISPPRQLSAEQLQTQLLPSIQAMQRAGRAIPSHKYIHHLTSGSENEKSVQRVELQLLILTAPERTQ